MVVAVFTVVVVCCSVGVRCGCVFVVVVVVACVSLRKIGAFAAGVYAALFNGGT